MMIGYNYSHKQECRSDVSPSSGVAPSVRSTKMRTKFIPRLSPSQEARFWAKAEQHPNGCWIWTASRAGVYGQFAITPREIFRAHRIAYTLSYGPIPDGLTVDHLCGNPLCVNPAHLEAVSSRVNTLRSNSNSAINARKTHCPHGHEYTPENTRTYRGGRLCRACGRMKQQWVREHVSPPDLEEALERINRTHPLGASCPHGHIYTEKSSRLILGPYGYRRFCRTCDAERARNKRKAAA